MTSYHNFMISYEYSEYQMIWNAIMMLVIQAFHILYSHILVLWKRRIKNMIHLLLLKINCSLLPNTVH